MAIREITSLGYNTLHRALLGPCKGLCSKVFRQSGKIPCGSSSELLHRSRPLFTRQSILLAITIVYVLGVTFLLTLRSPERFLSHFTTIGQPIYVFVQAHQTAIHFLSFYLLAFLICLFCKSFSSYLMSISLMVVYAIATEIAQMFLPGRCSDPLDLLANFAGISCGAVSIWVLVHIKSRVASRM